MRLRIPTAVIAALFSVSGACRSVDVTRSGFLSDYERLERAPDERARQHFVDGQADWSRYTQIVLEPLAIQLQESSLDTLSEEQAQTLRSHYRRFLRDAVGGELRVVKEPAPSTIVVRSALTEVDTVIAPLNWVTGIGILWPVDVGGATLEVELLDGATGAQLSAIVNADKATLWNAIQAMRPVGHACQALEETAGWVGQRIVARP